MKAPLPYHFCVILGCTEMTPPGASFCAEHCATEFGDAFFPGAESLGCGPADAPLPSSQPNNPEDSPS